MANSSALNITRIAAGGDRAALLIDGAVPADTDTSDIFTGLSGAGTLVLRAEAHPATPGGTGSVTITVQHSTDGNTWTTLGTFSALTDGATYLKASSPNDRIRFSYSVTGSMRVKIELSSVQFGGSGGSGAGLPSNVTTKTTTYTAVANDLVLADTSSAGFTVTLPSNPATGALVAVKNIGTGGHTLTIQASGGGTIDGSSTATTATQYAGVVLEHLGSNVCAITASMTTTGPQGPSGFGITPTAVKTSAYNAAAGDFVPVDTTSGAVTITLPTAPADGAVIAIKHVIRGGTNVVTLACGGSDVFNKASGSTSGTLTLASQGILVQYKASSAIWYVLSDDLPLAQLDLRYLPVVGAVMQSATPSINTDTMSVASITGLAQAITSMTTNLTGTPVDGQSLIIRITDNGTARAITWGASFEASTVALPTTTVISTMLIVGFLWNTATSKWRCVAVA